ncbi:glycosyltransferase [Alkalihalobacillus sp. FSL W8-0930]
MLDKNNITVIIPCYNGSKYLEKSLPFLISYNVLIIDSSSTDNTDSIVSNYDNVDIIRIDKADFNHGSTRNLGLEYTTARIVVYLTQDAIPVDENSIFNLAKSICNNENTSVAYGRQIPHDNASIFGEFARKFNYKKNSELRQKSDAEKYGIKTIFNSNSFAAYEKDVLIEVGGFPSNVILSEDTFVAAKMLDLGYKIAYNAEAKIKHSHNYTIMQEFRRYFDIGVFYGKEKWIKSEYSSAEGEGLKFIKSEMSYILSKKKIHLIPFSFIRNIMKYLGYRLGVNETIIPIRLKRRISMHNFYWKNERVTEN